MASSNAIVTPVLKKINQYLHQKVLLTSKWSLDKLILKNGQNKISWGDNSHLNDHKINSDICLQ